MKGVQNVFSARAYCIAHGTLLDVMWQPGWEGSLGRMVTCIYMVESLCCPPETIITLLIGYTPLPNKCLKIEFAILAAGSQILLLTVSACS